MVDIKSITAGLERTAEGIWLSRKKEEVAYPQDAAETLWDCEERSFWFQHRKRCLLALLQRYPPPGWFLDIGGGSGLNTHAISESGIEAVLLDPGPRSARQALTRGVERIIQATFEDAHLAAGCVPAAGLFDVLEHIEDDAGFLEAIFSACRADGRLYLTVPAYGWLYSNHDRYFKHFRRYTKRTLGEALRRAGFCLEYLSYFFQHLVLPLVLLRVIPNRLGLGKHTAARLQANHVLDRGWRRRAADAMLSREPKLLAQGRRIPFGASLIAVARANKPAAVTAGR